MELYSCFNSVFVSEIWRGINWKEYSRWNEHKTRDKIIWTNIKLKRSHSMNGTYVRAERGCSMISN